jgi:membrane protease YdiL (CAAX protease family)
LNLIEDPSQREARRLLTLSAWLYGGMVAVSLAWGTLRDLTGFWWQLETAAQAGTALGLGALVGIGGVVVTRVLEQSVDGVRRLGERFGHILRHAGPKEALLLALFSSVGEEMLFRGCLQQELGLWPATIAFALVHVGNERLYLWWTASALVFGLGLGLLYQAQGGLLAPIAMHFTINAINITLLAKRARET